MEIKVQIGTEERTFDVPEDLVTLVADAIDGAVRSDQTWKVMHKPVVETFYGPSPEGGEFLEAQLNRIRLGKRGDRFAWEGIYDLLMLKHPNAGMLRSAELQLLEGRGTTAERAALKKTSKDLRKSIRSVAASQRARILRYYLADFAPVRGIAGRAPKRVKQMIEREISLFQKIIDKPAKYSAEEAILALNVVTLLHSLIGEPTPLPGPAFAAHVVEATAHENHRIREEALAH